MVSQSKNGFPKDGFLKNLVNYMFPNQTSAFSRYPVTDSSKCISATDSSCFRTIIECITSYDSSVWFKLIVYKVKYSICCFKMLPPSSKASWHNARESEEICGTIYYKQYFENKLFEYSLLQKFTQQVVLHHL